MREAFSHRSLQRMIGRVVIVAVKLNGAELRIDDNEILCESVPAQQPAGLTRARRRTVQKVCEVRGFSIGDELIRGCELPQGLGATAVRSDGDRADLDALEHRVEQLRVPSSTRDVER